MKIRDITLLGFDPVCFFAKLKSSEASAAYVVSGPWTVITWNPMSTVVGSIDAVLQKAKILMSKRRHVTDADVPFSGGVIGMLSYEAGLKLQGIETRHAPSGIPDVMLHAYDNALLFDGTRTLIVGDGAFEKSVHVIHERPLPSSVIDPIEWSASVTREKYGAAFSKVMNDIRAGEYYQMNLTYQLRAESTCSPRELFTHLLRANPAPSASFLEHRDTAVVSVSPERFVTIHGRTITTRPIKGTRPRGSAPSKDKAMAKELLRSDKEAAELNMITDLLRNDIGKVSETGSVKVLEHRALQKNPSVWHTYSVVQGKLLPELHPFDAFLSMFPGGSVTGCPKVAAMKRIDALEAQSRGVYCGSMFMLSDGGAFDSSILIRTVVAHTNSLSLGVGGGIVADSRAAQEWDETLKKTKPFLALADTRRCFINGIAAHPTDARLKLLDPSNPVAHGVFETMRAVGGKVQDLSAHLRRLEHSAEVVGIKLPVSVADIKTMIAKILPADHRSLPARIKLVATSADIIIERLPLISDPRDAHGIAVTCVRADRMYPEAKALPYVTEWRAHAQAAEHGFGEAILVDAEGFVTEGAYSNVFWAKRGTLFTRRENVLSGLTRLAVLRTARKLRIPVAFAAVTPKELSVADEVFITKSTTGITPVTSVGGSTVANGVPGALTRRLLGKLA